MTLKTPLTRHFRWLVASISLGLTAAAFAQQPITSLRGPVDIGSEPNAPTIKHVPKSQPKFGLNYVNQPPLIPHAIDGYQITPSTNACLDCHDVENYRKVGALRISPTHFINRDNKLLTQVAARRYFCVQCHVPQAQALPLVPNEFKPVGNFGQ